LLLVKDDDFGSRAAQALKAPLQLYTGSLLSVKKERENDHRFSKKSN
jgi:hypothetical protein